MFNVNLGTIGGQAPARPMSPPLRVIGSLHVDPIVYWTHMAVSVVDCRGSQPK